MHTEPWETFRREFLEFFLPPRYYQSLEDAIRTRQQVGEPFKIYVVELRLMTQRAKYSLGQELERIYENLMPEGLTQLATAFEIARDRDPVRHAALIPTAS